MIGDYNNVSVHSGRLGEKSKCGVIKKCNNPAEFLIFCDDGVPKMSRLLLTSCKNHLHLAIIRAWKHNRKELKKWKRRNKKCKYCGKR